MCKYEAGDEIKLTTGDYVSFGIVDRHYYSEHAEEWHYDVRWDDLPGIWTHTARYIDESTEER